MYIRIFGFTDNPAYLYSAKMVSEGLIPYKDFLFVHPPMQIYILSLAFKFFGYNYLLLKFIPLLEVLIITFFLFKLIKNNFGNLEALLTVFFFIFSKTMLIQSSYSYGFTTTVAFIIIGLYLYFEKKVFAGGIFFGLAGITRLMSLPAFLIVFLFSALKYSEDKLKLTYRKAIKFALGFAAVFIPFFIFFVMLTDKFLQYVYFFHLGRISYSLQVKFQQFLVIFNMDKLLFLLPLVLFYFAFTKKTKIFFVLVLAYFIFIFNLPLVLQEYFLMVLPFLAVIIAVGVSNLLKKLANFRFNHNILLGLLSLILVLFFIPTANYTLNQYSKVYNNQILNL